VEIKQDEIKEVKKIGKLNGDDVKLIALKGGFHIGMGKKEKNSNKIDILAVGSHPALISHQISKQYPSSFEQTLQKSEMDTMPSIEEYSHHLTKSQKDVLGLDIYIMKKNEKVEFKVTQHNLDVFTIEANEMNGILELNKTESHSETINKMNKKELSKSLEKSIKEYAKKNNVNIKKAF
jgi:hypothetical protein